MPALLPTSLDRLEVHEIPAEYDQEALRKFIDETKRSEGAELANAQKVFEQLCAVLRVPSPGLKKAGAENPYVYEEDVKEGKRNRRIDVYRRGCFIFEAKQGVNPKAGEAADAVAVAAAAKARVGHTRNAKGAGVRGTTEWVDAIHQGRHQAGNYAVHVAKRGDPKPPFLLIADIGYRLWIWSSFSRDEKDDYGDFELLTAFTWDDIEKPQVFKLLRQIWLTPEELNEEARGQRITAKIAEHVSKLAVRLEKRFDAKDVGDFLMKCVFTMFAEDVGFLPIGLFTKRLEAWRQDARSGHADRFVRGLRTLWTRMRDGGDLESGDVIRHFNGYLFRDPDPLALAADEIDALYTAARADWRRVSPAIFGTLLERALSKAERQRLGAHYTPEAYIRRLVEKTLMDPLRAEWTAKRAEMEFHLRRGKDARKARQEAIEIGHTFRRRLASARVLDPACGSGNFLYVALKEMKRLEGEVVRALLAAGNKQEWLDIPGDTVHPAQFHGVEIKPWAAKIAELVLWIGYLQWQVSAGRVERMPPPLLQDLQHIKNADALITHKGSEPVLDEQGKPVMRARGVTDKKAKRTMVPVTRLLNVKKAAWPEADYIVGNPPFLGNKRLSDVLEPGYVDAIREAYPDVPRTADLVMYWWWRSAERVRKRAEERANKTTKVAQPPLRFGLVTTNSITQKFNRAVVAEALDEKGVKLAYAIPDHPWFDEGAAVRIAMTVGAAEVDTPVLGEVADERATGAAELEGVRVAEVPAKVIHADLSGEVNIAAAVPLVANRDLCFQGITLVGDGFRLSREQLKTLGVSLPHPVLKPYLIGRDIVQRREERWVIDFHGLSATQAAEEHPSLYEHMLREVKPQRDRQNDKQRKEKWWLFGRSGGDLRAALSGLDRFIATSRTSKHRIFIFVPADTLPDTKVVAIALNTPTTLAILSSRVHIVWSLRVGGWLGVGNDPTYNHLDCFGKFPFPSLTPTQTTELSMLGERLDTFRKARQAAHPGLTLTDMYNVLAKLRGNEDLDADEQRIRDQGLLDTLRQIHDDIDRAVLSAYDWPLDLSDNAIVERLVTLNAERAAEEARGVIRWLRPDYQSTGVQTEIADEGEHLAEDVAPATGTRRPGKRAAALPWPGDMPGRIKVLTALLRGLGEPTETRIIAMAFNGAKLDEVDITLRCAAAADAVVMTETENGELAWAPRAG